MDGFSPKDGCIRGRGEEDAYSDISYIRRLCPFFFWFRTLKFNIWGAGGSEK